MYEYFDPIMMVYIVKFMFLVFLAAFYIDLVKNSNYLIWIL